MPKNDLPSRRGEAKTSEGPSVDVQEFTIHIPDAALADMYDRLRSRKPTVRGAVRARRGLAKTLDGS